MDLLTNYSHDETQTFLKGLVEELGKDAVCEDERQWFTTTANRSLDWRFCPVPRSRWRPRDAEQTFRYNQVLALTNKYDDDSGDFDSVLSKAAYDLFLDNEHQCRRMNEFFHGYARGEFCLTPRFARVLYTARKKIAHILGPTPSFSDIDFVIGPGASTRTPRRTAHPADKLNADCECSPASVQYLPAMLANMPHFARIHAKSGNEEAFLVDVTVRNARLAFVPKTALKYRTIAIEPFLTSGYQLGIGRELRKRMARHGIDLSDQSINAEYARIGSITDELATLDLSNASDSVSTELVRFLLPPDWFSLLSSFRSPRIEYGRDVLQLEKFSSMGNGFTFPLESLIFWALSHAAGGFASVYGDDIVVRSSSAAEVIAALEMSGFTINTEKSFISGPFRESCGKDYWNGVLIRPWYCKGALTPYSLIGCHNFFFRRFGDSRLTRYILKWIPPHLRIYGPDGYGDGHLLHRDTSTGLTAHGRARGWSGYTFETYTLRGRTSLRVHPGDHIACLYFTYVAERLLGGVNDPYSPASIGRSRVGRLLKSYPRPSRSLEYHKIRVYTL